MTEYRDVLERELERLTPPRIPVDRLAHRRDRRRRNQRVAAGIVAVAMSMLAIGGFLKAFSPPSPSGEDRPSPALSVTALSYLDIASGQVTALPRPITGMVGLRHVSVSPEGSSIAFVGKRTAAARWQVFVANADGSDVRQLTSDEGIEATHPSWSPDGTRIVYEGDVGGDVDLFIVDVTSGDIRRLTEGLTPTPLVGVSPTPRFAPDGQTIIFTKTAPGSVQLWRTSTVGGGHPSLLRSGAGLGALSPDGTRLAFRYATADATVLTLGGIFLGDPDGGNADPLRDAGTTSGAFIFWDPEEVSASGPQWSPDGTRLLALHYYSRSGPVPIRMINVATKDATVVGRAQEVAWLDDDTLLVRGYVPPNAEGEGSPSPSSASAATFSADLSFVDLSTGRATPLPETITRFPGLRTISVSPDGHSFAFDALPPEGGLGQIFVANIDGSDIRQVTHRDDISVMHPSWSPDGSMILYEGHDGAGVGIYVVDVASGTEVKLAGHVEPPTFAVIVAPTFSADGSKILYAEGNGNSTHLRTIPVAGGRSSVLIRDAAFGSFSPDGASIAFRRVPHGLDIPGLSVGISVADADGSSERVRGGGAVMGAILSIEPDDAILHWSPDGRRIVYLDPFGQRTMRIFDLLTGRARVIGLGSTVSWFDDDTLIVRNFHHQ